MSKVLLLQLDGKIPNIALMRLAAHHRALGDEVVLRQLGNEGALERNLFDSEWDKIYGSLIFLRTKPLAEKVKQIYPRIILGGTGWDFATTLESINVTTLDQDYSDYPHWRQSIGFSQRGCRLRCSFCVVPKKEGAVRDEKSINEIWRGDPWPREVILLDNDFFGQPSWQKKIDELNRGHFKVSFNQGINVRMITDETAAAIASVNYRDDSMKVKRLYTAWDNRKDEKRLFAGLNHLTKYGVKPDHIMVYMLIGYWPGETEEDWLYRQQRLRDFGCRPYPMPYVRNPATVGFQRWIIGAYDKRIPWKIWKAANYDPRQIDNRPSIFEAPISTETPCPTISIL